MKHILVTGSNGQLGNELRVLSAGDSSSDFLFTDLPEFDISDAGMMNSFFRTNKVDALINCAAYTAVDKAESEPEKAGLINATAPGLLASAAEKYGFTLVHISTDYVFDGKHYKPYSENDLVSPASVYGKSKLEGENSVWQTEANALIIRTSWMYSTFGHNFLKTIIRLGKERSELRVVADQIGTPTYAADLAAAILSILQNQNIQGTKIYNYSNEGACSWYDFACAIVNYANIPCQIIPIPSSEYPTPAPRPHYSVLDKASIKNDFGLFIPWWYDSMKLCIRKIGE